MWRKFLVLFAVLALTAAACGGGTENADSDDVTTSETAAQIATDADASDTADENTQSGDTEAAEDTGSTADEEDENLYDEFESPLFDLLGFDPRSFEEVDFEQIERDRQLLVVECMADQGFEYQVQNFDFDVSFSGPLADTDIEWGTRKFAETYGYGISTFIQDEISSFEQAPSPDEFPEDPNATYLSFLSDAEREAWNRALYGSEPDIWDLTDDEGNPLNPDTGEPYTEAEIDAAWSDYDGGCSNTGFDDGSIFGEEQARLTAFYDQFDDLITDMEQRVENDPRVTALEESWVRCMADKSYSFTGPDDTYSAISQRMSPIYDEIYSSGGGFGGPFSEEAMLDESEFEAMTDEELDEYFADFAPQAPEITPETQAKIDELNEYEIAVAVADFDCTKPVIDGFTAVQREAEEKFIADNQGAITAFLEQNQG